MAEPFYTSIARKQQKAVSPKRPQGDSHKQPQGDFSKQRNEDNIPKADSAKKIIAHKKMFDLSALDEKAKDVLDNFDDIIQGVRPLNAKQRSLLSSDIARLSRSLTSERSERRRGYMNETTALTAYAHYFTWWNLVRLTHLFSAFPQKHFALNDGDVCLDIGSGPLTLPIALYLSHRELRAKKLTWYCLDLSPNSLALGEDLFLSIASKLDEECGWKIIRVKGSLGTSIKQKAALITCANMFNETIGEGEANLELAAKKFSLSLMSYADTGSEEQRKKPSILVIEPGVPKSARFISLLRDALIRRSYGVISPCPHFQTCPMNGQKRGKGGKAGKWCNFAFSTENAAPKKLLKLSENAKLSKDRAVLSFVFTKLNAAQPPLNSSLFRITSDAIRLEEKKIAHYACTSDGLALVVGGGKSIVSGDLLELDGTKSKAYVKSLAIDKKSGAFIQAVKKA